MKYPTKGRDPALAGAFVRCAKEMLRSFPEVKHEWSSDDDEDRCVLDIPEQEPDGFNVTVGVFPKQVTLFARGFHTHFDSNEDVSTISESAVGLVRDLLSPHMRLREFASNQRPYRWQIETWNGQDWAIEEQSGYLLWNWFGRKSERVFQNRILKGRLAENDS